MLSDVFVLGTCSLFAYHRNIYRHGVFTKEVSYIRALEGVGTIKVHCGGKENKKVFQHDQLLSPHILIWSVQALKQMEPFVMARTSNIDFRRNKCKNLHHVDSWRLVY